LLRQLLEDDDEVTEEVCARGRCVGGIGSGFQPLFGVAAALDEGQLEDIKHLLLRDIAAKGQRLRCQVTLDSTR